LFSIRERGCAVFLLEKISNRTLEVYEKNRIKNSSEGGWRKVQELKVEKREGASHI
jgi:hypothetical protein